MEAGVSSTGPLSESTLLLVAASPTFLDSIALGRRSFTINGNPAVGGLSRA